MKKTACPFLGIKDDPTTSLNFPSTGNFCHHSRPISPINANHQEKFCLSGEHQNCPLYRAATPVPMPRSLLGQPPEQAPARRTVPVFAIPLVLTGAALLAFVATGLGNRGLFANGLIPDTGQRVGTQKSWNLITGESPAAAPAQGTARPAAEEDERVCPLPQGWVQYTVAPTDSLFRLSVVYGVSVAELQSANCLGEETVIMPGDVIYLPVLPTVAPSVTPYRLYPAVRVINSLRSAQPQPTSDSSTSSPTDSPTAVPPTSVPPTSRPTDPPTVSPPQKPEEKKDKKDKKDENKAKKGKGEDKDGKKDDKGKGKK